MHDEIEAWRARCDKMQGLLNKMLEAQTQTLATSASAAMAAPDGNGANGYANGGRATGRHSDSDAL